MGMRAAPMHASAALVVEDDEVIAQVLRLLLEREGYGVSAVRDRRSIRTYMAGSERPQLITLDWTLPDVSGLTVLEWIRSTPEWHNVPVLLVTGVSSADVTRALKWDGVAYLRKPFTVNELSAAIKSVSIEAASATPLRVRRHVASSPIVEAYSCHQ